MPLRPVFKRPTPHKQKWAGSATLACHGLYRFSEVPISGQRWVKETCPISLLPINEIEEPVTAIGHDKQVFEYGYLLTWLEASIEQQGGRDKIHYGLNPVTRNPMKLEDIRRLPKVLT